MTDEQWQNLVGRIKDTFPVQDEFDEPLAEGPGTRTGIVFTGPAGAMKLERIVRPLLLNTTAIAAKRIGATATVKKEYSETETSSTVQLFRQQGEEWVPVDLDALAA